MENSLDGLLNNDYENLCGNLSKVILNESVINISNESRGIIRARLKYTPKNQQIEIEKEPVIIFVKEKNKIVIPYNSTYISLTFDIRNYNEEWVKVNEQTYFDPQNKNFVVSGDINSIVVTEV